MNTQTKLNKRGVPVLERLIQAGRVTFDESCLNTAAPDIDKSIEEAARILLEQRLENGRSLFPGRSSREIISTEEVMEVRWARHRKKCERIAAVRLLLFPLMDLTCSDWQEKFIGGLLAETFMLESDYESAFFWLAVSYPSPHYRASSNLNETRGRVHGFGRYLPRVLKTPESTPSS
jgi:hypothetical protein